MVRPPDFEALYAADPDPWHVRDSWYERRKEAVVLAVALTAGLVQACPTATTLVSALPAVPPLTALPDLVVLAEVLYYLPAQDRSQALEAVTAAARAEAEVVVVHWRHHPDDAHLSGADATEEADPLLQQAGWRQHSRHDDPDFVAASWVRA